MSSQGKVVWIRQPKKCDMVKVWPLTLQAKSKFNFKNVRLIIE